MANDLPLDLIAYILRGNVGPHTFANARQVNRGWAAACNDTSLLEAVASYVDGLTRTQFRGLLRLTSPQARSYPHKTRRTITAHGSHEFFLYAPATVHRALRDLGGLDGIHTRPLAAISPPACIDWHVAPGKRVQLEEKLHQRKVARLAFRCMRQLPPESTRCELQQAWRCERDALRAAGMI